MLNEASENLFLLPFQLVTLGQILFLSEPLQRGEPVLIVALGCIHFATRFFDVLSGFLFWCWSANCCK